CATPGPYWGDFHYYGFDSW
nr:immunoglobulin heavy chain junction region [Macaca mulatta]MOX14535.1 immunoglobulin heavy chain junction region [Macaca mulatta]MOX14565.1 immunoglobulin heavy chain junction region [Macaca mulatta]MOX14569.1 immunoglobulin heavy chain junction region [Macaca mulatta]MOX14646.1 immunoglobulin heavy chain junction region [Macaca mulatta]